MCQGWNSLHVQMAGGRKSIAKLSAALGLLQLQLAVISGGIYALCGAFQRFLIFSMVDDVRRPFYGFDSANKSKYPALLMANCEVQQRNSDTAVKEIDIRLEADDFLIVWPARRTVGCLGFSTVSVIQFRSLRPA